MNSRFMLDTDSVSFVMRAQGHVAEQMVRHRPEDLCVSAVTLAELRYGADLLKSRKLHGLIDQFIRNIEIMPFDESGSNLYGVIASELQKQGSPIGKFDVLIAAHAVAIDATLVTNNVKHFVRVPGLRVENWF
jgi:tRNA(fMet)-specific endonuclease VapC